MSYDIEMLRLSGPGELLTQALEKRSAEILRKDPTPSAGEDERRAKLAADLIALHPSLYGEPFDKGPSYGCIVDTKDPECCMPCIEIGIDSAIVNFSYSADFKLVLPELRRVIEVFERHGYTAYDRQTDSILSSSSNFHQAATSFAAKAETVVEQMQARGETVIGSPSRRKSFWIVAGVVIFLLLAIVVVLIQRHYARQTPPSVAKEVRSLQDRMNPNRPASPK